MNDKLDMYNYILNTTWKTINTTYITINMTNYKVGTNIVINVFL